ncbi:hypothetical protein [Leptospira levettii]|uniref:hypothetical protein n=1 Tax=Leptospira levettii TaxID=2023178 RepID=UPI0014382E84|nr:hypothetical protein [Leptospira levettii]
MSRFILSTVTGIVSKRWKKASRVLEAKTCKNSLMSHKIYTVQSFLPIPLDFHGGTKNLSKDLIFLRSYIDKLGVS